MIAKACIRSYSLLKSQNHLAARYTRLLESGRSKDHAWKVTAVEILAGAGIIAPEHPETSRASTRAESVQVPVLEAKVLKAIRIEPSDANRIRAVLSRAREEATTAKGDVPSESSVIRQAIRLGLDELERQRFRR